MQAPTRVFLKTPARFCFSKGYPTGFSLPRNLSPSDVFRAAEAIYG